MQQPNMHSLKRGTEKLRDVELALQLKIIHFSAKHQANISCEIPILNLYKESPLVIIIYPAKCKRWTVATITDWHYQHFSLTRNVFNIFFVRAH